MALKHRTQVSAQPKRVDSSIFDQNHFQIQTFGDSGLQREIIKLFLAQIDETQAALAGPVPEQTWRYLAHTLKGAAGAVGASRVAALAEAWNASPAPNEDERKRVVEEFAAACTAFRDAAKSYLD